MISHSVVFQKPDAIATPIYEKPNAYDEAPPIIITARRQGSRSSRMTIDSYASRYFQKKEIVTVRRSNTTGSSATTNTATTYATTDNEVYYSPNTPIESPPLSPKSTSGPYKLQIDKHITSFLLSQPMPTTHTFANHHHEEVIKDASPAISSVNSTIGVSTDTVTNHKNATQVVTAAATALLSNQSGILSKNKSRAIHHKKSTTTTTTNNVVVYNFKKASILKPNQHHIFLQMDQGEEELMAYRKIQPYSYTWGFQSMLYSNRNDGQGIKVAEARRRAFQKEVTIETADYNNSMIPDITQPHIPNLKHVPASDNIHSQELIKRSQSNLLFEYESWFRGSRMRWKRPSLLSHDFTCEIKLTKPEKKKELQELLNQQKLLATKKSKQKRKGLPLIDTAKSDGFIDSDSDNDEDDHDNHTHKTCRRWKLIAEFHSGNINYLSKELGKLSIDLDILNQVEKERCDLLEANLVMTCCTLIDLIRDVMGK
ncbi:hypothetical protein CU098_011194 [Rhizopus stolonifer]|uniref:Uncharacterized protein n=1 Tax=Rhizopus stolonifer TaxID=4846 RepID=A0A367KKA7_RHIST|nr:hypothetical protein CU098_011194 [Rhizopus stolonifer]